MKRYPVQLGSFVPKEPKKKPDGTYDSQVVEFNRPSVYGPSILSRIPRTVLAILEAIRERGQS